MKILEPEFVYCAGRKNIALAMLAILLILQLSAVLSGLFRLVFEIRSTGSYISNELLEINIDLYQDLFSLNSVVRLITYILFITWFVRAYRNHQALTKAKTLNTKTAPHGFFSYLFMILTFIWFRWFWRIYEITNEMLKGKNYIVSDLWRNEDLAQKTIIKPLVFFWWITVLLSLCYGSMSTNIWEIVDIGAQPLYELQTLKIAIIKSILSDIFNTLFCILSIKLIKEINKHQPKIIRQSNK